MRVRCRRRGSRGSLVWVWSPVPPPPLVQVPPQTPARDGTRSRILVLVLLRAGDPIRLKFPTGAGMPPFPVRPSPRRIWSVIRARCWRCWSLIRSSPPSRHASGCAPCPRCCASCSGGYGYTWYSCWSLSGSPSHAAYKAPVEAAVDADGFGEGAPGPRFTVVWPTAPWFAVSGASLTLSRRVAAMAGRRRLRGRAGPREPAVAAARAQGAGAGARWCPPPGGR